MDKWTEKRREKRLRYSWPVWFSEDFSGILTQGQMVDVSSGGASFTCYSDINVGIGQGITARFSVPKYEKELSFGMENYICNGHICRVQNISPYIRKVAVQFNEKLPFRPGEQTDNIEQFEEVLN